MIVKESCIYPPKGADRPLHIYLPEGYDASGERYPVMYFFDGHNLYRDEDATYGKSWGLKDFLDRWGKKIIVVGIECGHVGNERLSEYLPYPADPGSWFEGIRPMGKETMDWIVEKIKPHIDSTYRTIPFRECTGIAGSSMGGLMALYAAAAYNRWFSKAGCVSSAIGCCMGPVTADLTQKDISPDTRVYLSWGTREASVPPVSMRCGAGLSAGADAHSVTNQPVEYVYIAQGVPDQEDCQSGTYWNNTQAAGILEARGAAVKLQCQVGGGHCEADWEKLVPGLMGFLWE